MIRRVDYIESSIKSFNRRSFIFDYLSKYKPYRKALLEVQYFLSRDFSWDKKFRRACAQEAEELCEVGTLNAAEDEDEMEIPLSLVISCLYRHSHPFEDDIGMIRKI